MRTMTITEALVELKLLDEVKQREMWDAVINAAYEKRKRKESEGKE